ncbi:MAG TPA: C39 family peptidase [Vicinamibacterales bacterium]|nr:C39 family peptidase [Vicinamibacterales bacterium]
MRAIPVVAVILLLAAARAQAQPAILDVPYVSQSEDLCGGAAAAMVLRYWGERGLTAESFAPLVDHSASGIRTTALVADLVRRGWNAKAIAGDRAIVAGELGAGRPVIALIEDRPHTFHYIVIVGAIGDSVVFHDPARAALRVMARDDFERRWNETDRWMAVITPGDRPATPPALDEPTARARDATPCDEQIRDGIDLARKGDLESAGQHLVEALPCPGSAARRELAGVRLLQRRWDEAATLAGEAARLDRSDDYSWRLLGTSQFLLDHPLDALTAWNHVGEPKLDLIRVDGLERTRQRPVERLLGLRPGDPITVASFSRGERALRDLPSASSTRLELAPPMRGAADVHAIVAERPLVPHDRWSLLGIGASALIARTADATIGSISGGGESVALEWRFWPERPRVGGSFRSPAPWAGTWGVDIYAESQAFDGILPDARRRGGRLVAARWLSPFTRVEMRGGADRWVDAFASGGVTALVVSRGDRIAVQASADAWTGPSHFGIGTLTVTTTTARRSAAPPVVFTFTATAARASSAAPLDLWPAGDTGQARPVLLRAHPALDGGRLRVDRLGQFLLQASGEAQRWWAAPALSRIGVAAFVDTGRTSMRRGNAEPFADVDVGVGLRLSSAVTPGRIYLDVAHGLRDGATVFSARYVAAAW